MATSLSVAVMAHPKRANLVADLVARLDGDPQVVWDRRDDRWDTGRRALLAYDRQATHHLVVQDDALPCRDLIAGATEAVSHIPQAAPVSLYMGRTRPRRTMVDRAVRQARQRDASWATMVGPLWGVAIILPTVHIDRLVDWCDRQANPNYDGRISSWYRGSKPDCWYTVPSLVDHRGGESLVAGRTASNRVAHMFIGEDASPLDVDWSRR